MATRRPNVVFVFGDQWRGQAVGYAGDPNVKTPSLDRLAEESVNFVNAVAGCPVCSPYRASMLTGRYPLTHGVFVNDVCLGNDAVSLAQAFARGGYDTAYIGKWHVDGHGRSNFIPRERRQGFEFWKVLECTHDYNNSHYYADGPARQKWDGYDAIAQTREAQQWLRAHDRDRPFLMVLSWGPPHEPYQTAPEEFRRLYDPARIQLRPNVPQQCEAWARGDLAGYYAHCTALDHCVGELCATLRECRIEDDTILAFTSDHGDMHGSQGERKKQRPWDESIRVPFLLRFPAEFGREPRSIDFPIDAPDIMPTLLDLCGIETPPTVEGRSCAGLLRGEHAPSDAAALIACYAPFGQWERERHGGREYRGVRTARHTYVRTLEGPWLLYDNVADPFQMTNLCGRPEHAGLQAQMEDLLQLRLRQTRDEFLPGEAYIRKWGYVTTERGTVPYTQ